MKIYSFIYFCRTLTIHESDLFRKIRPIEMIYYNWKSEEKEVLSPNVSQLIQRFNEVFYIIKIILNKN